MQKLPIDRTLQALECELGDFYAAGSARLARRIPIAFFGCAVDFSG
jgi:hypothetical protein